MCVQFDLCSGQCYCGDDVVGCGHLPCIPATLILNRFLSSSTFFRPLSMKSSKRALNSDMRRRKSSKLKLSCGRVVAGLLARRCMEEEREVEKEEAGRSSWVVIVAGF